MQHCRGLLDLYGGPAPARSCGVPGAYRNTQSLSCELWSTSRGQWLVRGGRSVTVEGLWLMLGLALQSLTTSLGGRRRRGRREMAVESMLHLYSVPSLLRPRLYGRLLLRGGKRRCSTLRIHAISTTAKHSVHAPPARNRGGEEECDQQASGGSQIMMMMSTNHNVRAAGWCLAASA